jgi:prevent-host-death family protein
MAMVNIHDAKTHFSKLLTRVENGEEIVIAKTGKPVARLSPLARQVRSGSRKRQRPYRSEEGISGTLARIGDGRV